MRQLYSPPESQIVETHVLKCSQVDASHIPIYTGLQLITDLGGATGADVTHPVGFNQNSPSVAAVVGSLDRQLSCFGSQILPQGHRVELLLVRTAESSCLMVLPVSQG